MLVMSSNRLICGQLMTSTILQRMSYQSNPAAKSNGRVLRKKKR